MDVIRQNNDELFRLAQRTAQLSTSANKRVEDIWLGERYGQFLRENGIRTRAEGDERISRIMCELRGENVSFEKSDIIKVRYWRTGQHYPRNRETCVLFGQALGLDGAEQRRLMTEWYNRSDRVFEAEDTDDNVYMERAGLLGKLQTEFLEKQRPEELLSLCAPGTAPSENLRYIYCRQALNYLSDTSRKNINAPLKHLDTRSYQYQFAREMKLFGEISRVSMIRHLLILGMPFVSRSRVSGWLKMLGYMPLREDHRTPYGIAEDLPVLGLLELYEKTCTGVSPEQCTEWFCRSAGTLGDMLVSLDCAGADPFRFKHLLGGSV